MQPTLSPSPSPGSHLALLLSPEPGQVVQAVEKLVGALQQDREGLLQDLLTAAECSQYLRALCNLLMASDVKLCSNAAYLLGRIAENEVGASCLRVLSERQSAADWHLLGTLAAMLTWDDSEAVMNTAGTLGTLAETRAGRQWLLKDPHGEEIIENITTLLDSADEWTASNAALVLARITMCQEGCAKLLGHPKSSNTLRKLIASLGVDDAGYGLNAAFALGRLCNTDAGLKLILSFPEADNMISALESMMANGDAGGSRSGCFALSCLATDKEGHEYVLRNAAFAQTLDTLCRLLQSEEQESSWFAAMALKVLASQPRGVVKLRDHPELESVLKKVAASKTTGKELFEEVSTTLQKLWRLPRPPAPEAKTLDSGCIWVGWEQCKPDSGLQVTYRLYERDTLLHEGFQCSYVLSNTMPSREYHFKLGLETEGDRSPYSHVTTVTLEESVSSCPLDFQVTGRTATHLKLNWAPPAEPNGIIKYYTLCRGDAFLDSTSELSYIVGGLSPSTSYTFSVCAFTRKGKGKKTYLVAKTMDTGDHAPGKLTLYVVGRSEIFITWNVPRAPLGRFFNYELCLNGKVVYLGTERSYTARRLTANTEYTCTVSAITSEGRCESKPVTKRTAKDEYENINKGYYFPVWNRHSETSSAATETPDTSEKPERSSNQVGPPKPSLSKPLKAFQSKRTITSKESEGNTKPALRSRRNSTLSWSTESSEEPAPPLVSSSEASKLSTVAKQSEQQTAILKSSTTQSLCQDNKEGSLEMMTTRHQVSSEKLVYCPLRSLAFYSLPNPSTTTHSTGLFQAPRKPHNTVRGSEETYQSLPTLENLSEYLVQQRAKTESELLCGLPREKKEIHKWRNLDHISSIILLDKEQNPTLWKAVETKKAQLQAWTDLHVGLSQTPLQQKEGRRLKGKLAPRNRKCGSYDMKLDKRHDNVCGRLCYNLRVIDRRRQCSDTAARFSAVLTDGNSLKIQ